jgi:hypothetical protein
MPTARAYHTLTLVGHVMVAVGGSGPMGPLLDLHLLESPPLVAGLAQQYRLMATAAQLSATQAGMADMEAALAVTRHRAESAEQQLQVGGEATAPSRPEPRLGHRTTLAPAPYRPVHACLLVCSQAVQRFGRPR